MSHSRKHLLTNALTQVIDLTKNQRIVKVIENKGQHIYLVEFSSGDTTLTLLPAKFRNTIWIKRGDYLIIEIAAPEKNFSGKIRSIIKHVLYTNQITHLKSTNNWPLIWDDNTKNKKETNNIIISDIDEDTVYVNPNRRYVEDDIEDEDDIDTNVEE